ncbi:MAG: carbamoylphosphate synthase large subunit short form [Bacillales bacterium]|jgi:hypothetical protein|nr:carbamoylphosphate synthase large subunit short form [Bacillales bacterium]
MVKNILVFPCGSEIGLEINNALKFVKNINLFGGSSVSDHGKYVYKNYIEGFPHVDSVDFISNINEVIEKYKIDYIFPAHDSVVLTLGQNQHLINAEILTSTSKTCEICRSKKKTYEYFVGNDFIPQMYYEIEDVKEFPVFLKPDVGQGSNGIALVKNMEELLYQHKNVVDLLTLEYLPGKEYSVDCFTDRNGELKFVGMRERRRVKSGISVNSMNLALPDSVKKIAKIINSKLEFRGMWFFQVKEDVNGLYKLLEIAPRVSGTMNLYRNKGINFPQLCVFDRMGHDVEVIENNFDIEVDRALTNRFNVEVEYKRVYIDFDDTVTLKGNINPYVMMFIYQCISKNIELILITKHMFEIRKTLNKYGIDEKIFEEIMHIKREDKKYKYIKNKENAIFIDDSFVERKEMIDNLGIPVFDIDAIESLIDWRY